jgi:uncharacterized protein (TIGR03083 family)
MLRLVPGTKAATLGQVNDNGAAQVGVWSDRGGVATAALAETWGSLAEVCHELSATEWLLPTECPGWSVQDQLGHIIGVERSLLGQDPPQWDAPLGDHVKNDFAAMNEKWIAARRERPGAAVLAEFREVTEARLAALDALTGEQWATVGFSPVGEVPYAEFMNVRVFDCWVHEQDTRLALDRPGGSGGMASDIALGRVQSAMPFVVGKKASAPEGTVVRFSVAGPGDDDRRFDIGVESGRARLLTGGAVPTVTLVMSSIDFTRLGCGRADPGTVESEGGVGMEGDLALGRSFLSAMNFMF